MIDVKHCYMRDMYTKEEVEDIHKAKFKNCISWKKRTVNGLNYRDPDLNCKPLYDDLRELFFDEHFSLVENDPYCKNQLIISDSREKGIRISSDYIGPSLTSMFRAGIDDQEAWEMLLKCRTIGGHLVWPRVSHGINPSKASSGARNYGISDRIDIALYELKNWLEYHPEQKVLNKKMQSAFKIEDNIIWFQNTSFPQFCERFRLKGSFVDNDYNIKWFVDPEPRKLTKKDMTEYIKNNVDAIEERNKQILLSIAKEL